MSHGRLKERVLAANLALPRLGLVQFTWGNASARDATSGAIAIKPSGVPYETMQAEDIVVLDLDGRVLEGRCRPSSDLATHLELYRAFPEIGGVVHTHSLWATVWAQARRGIPAFGTTHADHFHGEVPCTRPLTEDETHGDYEALTGQVIVDHLRAAGIAPLHLPAILVACHGPFTWGHDVDDAVQQAAVLEITAQMAFLTTRLAPDCAPIDGFLLDKHFSRKHGPRAYYGQARAAPAAPEAPAAHIGTRSV